MPSVGSTDQVRFIYWILLISIFWKTSLIPPMVLVPYNLDPHPLITGVQEVPGVISQHLLRQFLTELLEVHGSFHLPFLLYTLFVTLQLRFIIGYNGQIIDMRHRWVSILETLLLNMEAMDEVVNAVNLAVNSRAQIPDLVRLYVQPPFVFTSTPTLH